jgi:hypothetical protein
VRVLPHAPKPCRLPIPDLTLDQHPTCKVEKRKLKFDERITRQSAIGNRQSKMFWKGSLTGKAVVLKTTAHSTLAGSSPVPSAKTLPTFDCRLIQGQRPKTQDQIANRQSKIFWICSSVELERDPAKVEVARSNRARSAKTRRGDKEMRRRGEVLRVSVSSCLRVSLQAGVAQLGGGTSLRN